MSEVPRIARSVQRCYSYTGLELAKALGLAPADREWVVVEVDEESGDVDVMIRKMVGAP